MVNHYHRFHFLDAMQKNFFVITHQPGVWVWHLAILKYTKTELFITRNRICCSMAQTVSSQGCRNDFQNGRAWSPNSGITSELCLSMLATASLSKLLENEQLENGSLWHLLPEKSVKVMYHSISCKKVEIQSPRHPGFDAPIDES